MKVHRERTAIRRQSCSLPLRTAKKDGVLRRGDTAINYGCGRGDDVNVCMRKMGVNARGYDPHYRPRKPRRPADVVSLGFVINTIESKAERAAVIRDASRLARKVLVVAARTDCRSIRGRKFKDGRVTSAGTFQKCYTSCELKREVERATGEKAIVSRSGVVYVVKDKALAKKLGGGRPC